MDNYADLWEGSPNYKFRASKDLLALFINKEGSWLIVSVGVISFIEFYMGL